MKINFLKLNAVLLIVLGGLHITATPQAIASFPQLNNAQQLVFGWAFIGVGVLLLLAGAILLITKKIAHTNPVPARQLASITTAILLAITASGVYIMPANPFAYIALLLAVSSTIASFGFFRNHTIQIA